MILKIKKPGFIPAAKTVRFGYDESTYQDLFQNKEYVVHFYPSGKSNEYLTCIDEIQRDTRVGTLIVLDLKKVGNKRLLEQALSSDYHLDENEYEIVHA